MLPRCEPLTAVEISMQWFNFISARQLPLSTEFVNPIRYGVANVKSRILLLRIKIKTFFFTSSRRRCSLRRYFPYTAKNFQLGRDCAGRLASLPFPSLPPETRHLNFLSLAVHPRLNCADKVKKKCSGTKRGAFMLRSDSGKTRQGKTCKFANYTF